MTSSQAGKEKPFVGLLRLLRRVDAGWARGEAAVAAFVLLVLIVIAAVQALLRNLTLWDVRWANAVLEQISWGDSFMQKATLWLAFLGASLATQGKKHIAIDIVPRIVPPRVGALSGGLVWAGAAATCAYLAHVFFLSVMNNAADLPFDYQAMNDAGESIHRCDAPLTLLDASGLPRPGFFCAIRSLLTSLGAPISTPDNAFQLIVPVMLVVMAIRFAGYGTISLLRGFGMMRLEPARVAAENEHVSLAPPPPEPAPGDGSSSQAQESGTPEASAASADAGDSSADEGDSDEPDPSKPEGER